MMTGSVSPSLEALLPLTVQGPGGIQQVVAILDTGFSSFLTLPLATIIALKLPWLCRHQGMLADGALQVLDAYEASVRWDGQMRTVEVMAIDALPLAGMSLLHGCELRVEVKDGGVVAITPLP